MAFHTLAQVTKVRPAEELAWKFFLTVLPLLLLLLVSAKSGQRSGRGHQHYKEEHIAVTVFDRVFSVVDGSLVFCLCF